MPQSSIFCSECFASTSASSEAGSWPGMALDRSFVPRSIEGHQGFSCPVAAEGYGGDQDRAGGGVPAGGPIRRRPGTNRTAPTVEFPAQCCPDCTDGRVFRTRSSYTGHLKCRHAQYWNKRGWIGFIGRPARRRFWDAPRTPPPAPLVAEQGIAVEALPPRATHVGVLPPRFVIQRDAPPPATAAGALPPRAAAREALPPRSANELEVWSPRAAVAGALSPRSALAVAMDAPSQPAVAVLPPAGTGI